MNDVGDLLRELVAGQHETNRLLREIVERRAAPRVDGDDRELLAALLPAVADAVIDRVFTVRELTEHARLPRETALRAAMAAAGGPLRVGHLFKRGQGVTVDGLTVERVGEDRDGRVWRVCGDSRRNRRTDE